MTARPGLASDLDREVEPIIGRDRSVAVIPQTLTGLDTRADDPGRMRIATLRRQLQKTPDE